MEERSKNTLTEKQGGKPCPHCGELIHEKKNRKLDDIKRKVLRNIKFYGTRSTKEIYEGMIRAGYGKYRHVYLKRWIEEHPDYRWLTDDNGSVVYYIGNDGDES